MAIVAPKLSPIERVVFGSAIVLAVLVLAARLGTFAVLWFSHHAR
jgi:hypothetical protein